MADAVHVSTFQPFGAPFPHKTTVGWVGSKLGTHGHIVTVDANGYIDQACAASAAISATLKVAMLCDDIAAAIAAASDDALAVRYQPFSDQSLLEMQVVTNSDTAITLTAANEGDMVAIYRCTNDAYAWDTNAVTHAQIVKVDLVRNTAWGRFLPTLCLA